MDNGALSYRRFLDGDDSGIVEIIRDYKDGLMLYINSLINNIHVSEDLMEETFVKLAVRKPKFSEKSSFKTWLYAIGRNVAIDYLRKNSKTLMQSVDEKILVDQESVEVAYIREERKITVHRAMQGLNPDYRQVLYLIYFEGFDNTQASAVMKKSKHQIENLAYRAKMSLKSQLEKEGFVYEEL
ncbi:MAG: RNA polymerase sigma factor [Clostridia bacterium]|nr:RNA polymerase sigma factor [Clostridia bacterium]